MPLGAYLLYKSAPHRERANTHKRGTIKGDGSLTRFFGHLCFETSHLGASIEPSESGNRVVDPDASSTVRVISRGSCDSTAVFGHEKLFRWGVVHLVHDCAKRWRAAVAKDSGSKNRLFNRTLGLFWNKGAVSIPQ